MSSLALSCYKQIVSLGSNVMEIGKTVPIPRFSQEHILKIINEANCLLRKGNPLVYSDSNVVIVGDIHGSLHDIFLIFSYYGYPPKTKYIFLGDYVDRGDYSLEVITFLLILYIQFPDQIILIRGNHEFSSVNKLYGFKNSIELEYNSDMLWYEFNKCFDYFPIACVIDNETICLHGGISTNVASINSIKNLTFPLSNENIVVSDIVWSDPSINSPMFLPNNRGLGQMFGAFAFKDFLVDSGLSMMIRAHECVDGIKRMFNGKLITVFSSSNYCTNKNRSGAILYKNREDIIGKVFPSLERVPKNESVFFPVICPTCNQIPLRNLRCSKLSVFKNSDLIFSHAKRTLCKHKSFPVPSHVTVIETL